MILVRAAALAGHTRAAVVLAAAVLLGGCASHRPSEIRAAVEEAKLRIDQQAQNASAAAPARKTPQRTVESTDPGLAAALLDLARHRTGDSLRRVAGEYRRLGLLDVALARFDEALRLDPRDAAAYDGRARALRDSGFPGFGLSDAHRAVYFAPRSAIAANTLGTVLESMGHFRAAKQEYARALYLDASANYAQTNLCHVQTRLGERDAVSACQSMLARTPASTVANNNMALAYAAAGDFDRAAQTFAAVTTPAAAAYNMGIVYMAARQLDLAEAAFDTAGKAGLSAKESAPRLKQLKAMREQ